MRFRLPDEDLLTALSSWDLAELSLVGSMRSGTTADVWRFVANGETYVAKFAYDSRQGLEDGLKSAEILETTGFRAGGPIRTRENELTVMVEGPPGKHHPLAVLRFAPGRPLQFREPEAPSLIGEGLGRAHRLLIEAGYRPSDSHSTYGYLLGQESWPEEMSWVGVACAQAAEAAHSFEESTDITHGTLYGDYPEFLFEEETGQLALIDWGTVSYGALLFDAAITYEVFDEVDHGGQEFLDAYVGHSPMKADELSGLDTFVDLHGARMAKYFAWRTLNAVTSGNMDQDHNRKTLARYKSRLGY